jgi:hypothetical protein
MNDKWPHGEAYTIIGHNNGTNEDDIFNYETNGSFKWGLRVYCSSLINIVRTNVIVDGEDSNNLPSLEQKFDVEMPTSSTTTKNLRKVLNHWNWLGVGIIITIIGIIK